MTIADAAQFAHKVVRSDDIPALTLNRLDEDRSHFLRSNRRLEEFLLDRPRAAQRESLFFLRPAAASTVSIGKAHMRHPRHQRRKAPFLLWLRPRERKRAHRSPMKRPKERNHLLALGVITSDLQRALHSLGARVAVVKPMRPRHGSHRRKPVAQL